MEKINKLREQFQAILDKVEDKEMIASLSELSVTIDEIDADTTALEKDNRDLLSDYKEMIKHTSFKVEQPVERGTVEPPKFEDFLKKLN